MCRTAVYLISCIVVLGASSYIASAAGPTPDVLWWGFDEGAGDTVVDLTGNGRDGTISGPTWTPGGADGKGYCLDFAGDGGTVIDDDAEDFLNGLDGISVAVWIKSDEVGTDAGFVWFVEPDGGDNGGLRYDAASWAWPDGTNLIKTTLETTGSHLVLEGSDDKQTTAWQHVVMTWASGEELKLYIDGQLDTPRGVDPPAGGEVTAVTTLIVGKGAKDDSPGAGWNGLIDDLRIYSWALSPEEIQDILKGDTTRSTAPEPAGGATDVPRDAVLSWTAGEFAAAHDVYLGTSFDDVNAASRDDPLDVLVSQGQTAASYDPPAVLDLGQTYYWRVDEVNGAPDDTIFRGAVWSFTVEPLAYAIDNVVATASASDPGVGPENTVNGSGLNADDQHSVDAADMWLDSSGGDPVWLQYEFDRLYKMHELWVWNYNVQFEPVLGFGLKDVTIEYSTDGAEWMALGDFEFAQATAMPTYTANTVVDLSGVAARYVRLIINDNWGMLPQFGLSEVRFFQIPTFPRQPQPEDGAADVSPDAVLSWRAGREAATHDVFLGTSAEMLALADTVETSGYMPPDLAFGTRYAWRIDEVNEAEVPSVWEGDVWTFSTLEYVVIDDMESYDDDENRIFDAWLDGFVNGTGATVGYFEAPFAETTIVNGGSQSMPLEYVNDVAPFYSEAEYDLGSLNLETNGADTLRLLVSGQAPGFLETAGGSVLMNAIGNDIWGTADQFRYAYRTLSGDGSMTVRVDAIDGSPDGWVKGGAMIRQNTEPGAVNAFTAVTGGSGDGATFQWRETADTDSSSSRTLTGIAPPYYARIVRQGNTFTGYLSADGENWEQQGDSSVDVAMTDPVLIGLALTSHNVDQATSAEFADISFTGNVSASWEMAEVGATQPVGNDVAPLYVALEDTSGNVAVVTHPDESVVGRSGWNEWLIPYGDLAGVNLGRVAIMYIGVGDRDNPTAGGTGMIFIDDIGYGKPAAVE